MVHKRFVRKNGKLHGPYYYESYREGDKVKKRYIGKKLSLGLKKTVVASLLILFLTVVFASVVFGEGINGVSSSNSLFEDEWSMFGRHLNHSSYTNSSTPENISATDTLAYTASGAIASTPIVVNNSIYFGSRDDAFYQVNASNVSQYLANYTTGGDIDSSPAYAGGFVYFGSDDEHLYQVNATNASHLINKYNLTESPDGASPTIEDGYVYMASFDGQAYQLNATNISELINNYTLYTPNANPEGSKSFIVSNGNAYTAIIKDVGAGSSVIVYQLNSTNVSNLINTYSITAGAPTTLGDIGLSGESIYFVEESVLYQLNSTNVSRAITAINFGFNSLAPAIRGNSVFALASDRLYQLNATNVSTIIANISSPITNTVARFSAVNDDYLFISSNNPAGLYQFNATNLTSGVAFVSITDLRSSPIIVGGSVYVGGGDNKLHHYGNLSLAADTTDSTGPVITINFPGNVSYGSANLSLDWNITINENGTASYSFDNGLNNFSMSGNESTFFGEMHNATNATMAEGQWTFYAYVNDTSANANYTENVTFVYDATTPNVTINSPVASTTYTSSTVDINITLEDGDGGACVYSIDAGLTNGTLEDNGKVDFTIARTGNANADFVLWAYCNDYAGNRNFTTNVSYTVAVPAAVSSGGGGGGGGGSTVTKKEEKKDEAIILVEDCQRDCGEWSTCDPVDKERTRTCSLIGNAEGCSGTIEDRNSCVLEVCEPVWVCGDWSEPLNGKIKRKCVDVAKCSLEGSANKKIGGGNGKGSLIRQALVANTKIHDVEAGRLGGFETSQVLDLVSPAVGESGYGGGGGESGDPVCGNGDLDSGESCDDGNLINGDGCSVFCEVEKGDEGCNIGQVEECSGGFLGFGEKCACVPNDDGIICSTVYAPVCGTDGVTYGNQCKIKKAWESGKDIDIAYNGECVPDGEECDIGFVEECTGGFFGIGETCKCVLDDDGGGDDGCSGGSVCMSKFACTEEGGIGPGTYDCNNGQGVCCTLPDDGGGDDEDKCVEMKIVCADPDPENEGCNYINPEYDENSCLTDCGEIWCPEPGQVCTPQQITDGCTEKEKFSLINFFTRESEKYCDCSDIEDPKDPVCGNGILEENEGCDAGPLNGVGCTPEYRRECSYCSFECKQATFGGGSCGDGNIDYPDEDCDAGTFSLFSQDCTGDCKFRSRIDEDRKKCEDKGGIYSCSGGFFIDCQCILPKEKCGNGQCEEALGETAENCAVDCFACPVIIDVGCSSGRESYEIIDEDTGCVIGYECREIDSCKTNLECNDGNSCTSDRCDSVEGCVNTLKPNGNACNDGNSCTRFDSCSDVGICQGTEKECAEGEICELDTGLCVSDDRDSCILDSECTEGEECNEGYCETIPVEICDDGIDNDSDGLIDLEDGDCVVACPNVEDPVCGVDGETYGNSCLAEKTEIEIDYDGVCDDLDGHECTEEDYALYGEEGCRDEEQEVSCDQGFPITCDPIEGESCDPLGNSNSILSVDYDPTEGRRATAYCYNDRCDYGQYEYDSCTLVQEPECGNDICEELLGENDVNSEYYCSADCKTECPPVAIPACAEGEELVSLGDDENGCSLGSECVSQCPVVNDIGCSVDQERIEIVDEVTECVVRYECRILPPECGNGNVDSGEECDDGNSINTDSCIVGEGECVNAECGDGFIEFGVEECDDGNLVNGDGCNSECQPEAACSPLYCEALAEGCGYINPVIDETGCMTSCGTLECTFVCGNKECEEDLGEAFDNCAADCPLVCAQAEPSCSGGDPIINSIDGNSCVLDYTCCGNDVCESEEGETSDNCASDCRIGFSCDLVDEPACSGDLIISEIDENGCTLEYNCCGDSICGSGESLDNCAIDCEVIDDGTDDDGTIDDDLDDDGIPNDEDDDLDGDGIDNDEDDDMDGDGIPNEDDSDDDSDGVLDYGEEVDDDRDDDGISNDEDDDMDGDGIDNENDTDTDGDGVDNGDDGDVDNDGVLNGDDEDVDGDGIDNENDSDIDGDGIDNDDDLDSDGDSIIDPEQTVLPPVVTVTGPPGPGGGGGGGGSRATIRDRKTGLTGAVIDIDSWKEDGELDISFVQSDSIYPESCSNAVLDETEESVDCGGDCKGCVLDKRTSPLSFLIDIDLISDFGLWAALLLTVVVIFWRLNEQFSIFKFGHSIDKEKILKRLGRQFRESID